MQEAFLIVAVILFIIAAVIEFRGPPPAPWSGLIGWIGLAFFAAAFVKHFA